MNLLLLESADGPAVLHVFDGGVCVRTAIGRAAALREVYVPAFYPGCEIEEVTSDQLPHWRQGEDRESRIENSKEGSC
jgi:hypothetical protein